MAGRKRGADGKPPVKRNKRKAPASDASYEPSKTAKKASPVCINSNDHAALGASMRKCVWIDEILTVCPQAENEPSAPIVEDTPQVCSISQCQS